MPTGPATPRRSSTNRRSAPVTPIWLSAICPNSLGIADSNTVRDRVRKWQEQAAKVAASPAPSDDSVAGDENADARPTSSPPVLGKETLRGSETTPRRRTSRQPDSENTDHIEQPRSSSTPRKRVVSDEHWKKKQKRSPRSGQTIRQANLDARSPDEPKHTSSKIDRQARRRRSKKKAPGAQSSTVRDADAEAEPNASPSCSRRNSGHEVAQLLSDLESGVDDNLPERFQSRISPHLAVEEWKKSATRSPVVGEISLPKDQPVEVLGRPASRMQVPIIKPAVSLSSRKSGNLRQAKEMSSQSEPMPQSSQRLPSIEAWLNEQPDPFVDGDTEPVEIPAPLKTRSNKRNNAVIPNKWQDPNGIWNHVESEDHRPEELTRARRSRRRKQRKSQEATELGYPENKGPVAVNQAIRKVSPTSQDRSQETKGDSPGTLKRRGATALRAGTSLSPKNDTAEVTNIIACTKALTSPLKVATVFPVTDQEEQHLTRACPPTGTQLLPPKVSVETLDPHTERVNEMDALKKDNKGLQRRLTTHEDLMSVLSLPRAGGSIKSARSIRTSRSRVSTASLGELQGELEVDEAKYMRELITLVDGVIPVLLQCVLSKSDSAAAAGLFSSSGSARDDLHFTRPIVDMGVALERLKTMHKRITTRDINSLLSWAHNIHKVYIEYLQAWRLGFQDVVVNLAPPTDNTRKEMDEGMARDEDGDVINSEGKKVDVAYLLKRPLVRIKNLAKVFTRLKMLQPSSKASMVADKFDELIRTARRRSNEEQSRLEDEAAANIDPTKTRDLRTLAVLSGVRVDKSRRVRARDCFSLTVHHSSGQRLDCHTELLLRDNEPGLPAGGDLLLCEVENNGKWLLFPPLETGSVSARHGENDGEIVVMVRGPASSARGWQELLLLKTGDMEAASEWVEMLGSQPIPPQLNRSSSFTRGASSPNGKRLALISRSPSLKEIEVPIGEPSVIGSTEHERPLSAPKVYQAGSGPDPTPKNVSAGHRLPLLPVKRESKALPAIPISSPDCDQTASSYTPLSDTSSPGLKRGKLATKKPARREDNVPSSSPILSSPTPAEKPVLNTGTRKISRTDSASREWMSSPSVQRPACSDQEDSSVRDGREPSPESRTQRPQNHRAISSTPGKELPTIHRIRPNSPASKPSTEPTRHLKAAPSDGNTTSTGMRPAQDHSDENAERRDSSTRLPMPEDAPPPPPHRSQSRSSTPPPPSPIESLPIPRLHRPTPLREQAKRVAALKPQSQPALPLPHRRNDRRSSSPLKHEYAPSTASESDSDDESITSSSSETSEDGGLERVNAPTGIPAVQICDVPEMKKVPPPASLPNLPAGSLAPSNSASQAPYRTVPRIELQVTAPTTKTVATVCSWSDKGWWESLNPDECSIVVSPGLIEAYEMSAAHSEPRCADGEGETLHGSPSGDGDDQVIRPLVAFELTPLVPLRRGTALDISIRSPPTARSKVKTSNNIMFRSRNAEECEALYALINYARINNPTWIALEKARPREIAQVSFNTGPGSARHSRARSRSGSWFGFGTQGKRSSYRASSAPLSGAASITGVSESSVGSMSSAFSALRRFSGAGNAGREMFNLNRSSVMRKHGRSGPSGSASLYSSSSGTTATGGSGSGATSPAPSQLGLVALTADAVGGCGPAAPSGSVNNMKIRLYVRESASKWRDLGAARLTVMPAPIMANVNVEGIATAPESDPSPPGTASGSRPPSTFTVGQAGGGQARGPRLPSSNHTPHRVHGNGNEKRIVVTGKTKGETLLDATLHESCFERMARTGIAISVWEEHEEVAKSGGVVGGKGRTYMLQMKGEAEAGWVFGMVGRLRY